jgi:hypothetical protein
LLGAVEFVNDPRNRVDKTAPGTSRPVYESRLAVARQALVVAAIFCVAAAEAETAK